ncbi:MAG: hypothetical protein L6V95_06120 [Candidatus Melainabacteria bacterium]|nr:MAG: hypothetical protein L6V95_06120 [Candidatus Melainabacteria bacterium]
MTDDGKPVTFSSGINWSQYYFNYKAPSEKFQNKNIEQSFMKPGYYRGEEMQNPYLNMYYEDRNLGLFNIEPKGLRMVSNEDNSKSMVSKTFGDRYMGFLNSQIPLPALKTENGETKTTFIPLDNSHLYHEIPLEPLFDSQVDVENNSSVMQNMIRFVNNVDDNSPAKEKEFKKQFNMIDFFQDNKYEVFDEPVKLAKKLIKN